MPIDNYHFMGSCQRLDPVSDSTLWDPVSDWIPSNATSTMIADNNKQHEPLQKTTKKFIKSA